MSPRIDLFEIFSADTGSEIFAACNAASRQCTDRAYLPVLWP